MKGNLAEGLLPGLLREIYVGRKTGVLHFSLGEERRSVRLRRGNLVHADTNVKEDRLGETLVRHEIISAADLKRATGFVLRDRKRLGLVILEQGILDKDRLEDGLEIHLRETLMKVFAWNEGAYHFKEEPEEPEPDDATMRVSTGEMILTAVRGVQDPDVIRYALGDIDRILGRSADPFLRFQKITLSPTDGYVLSRIDGTLSCREVLQLSPQSPTEVQRSLFGLLCTGVIEYLPLPPKRNVAPAPLPAPRPVVTPRAPVVSPPLPPQPRIAAQEPPPQTPADPELLAERQAAAGQRREVEEAYAALKTRNHFEVLGLPRASSEAQVKEAYFRLAKRFHPDSQHDPLLSDLHAKLEAVFIRLGQAYEVLRNPRSRSAYEEDLTAREPRLPKPRVEHAEPAADPSLEANLAEDAIKRCERLVKEEKFWDAIQLLESAVPRAQSRIKQRGRVLLARSYLKNPNWLKQAEYVLLEATQEDPQYAEPFYMLGTIYKSSGLRSRATSMFRKAVELKPEHEEAVAELRAILAAATPTEEEPVEEKTSGGLLKKLFRKE
jgi:tetratricopeptide (TPR) repeat protein